MVPVFLFGDFAHRIPLAYAPIASLCHDRIKVVDQIHQAKLILIGHSKDIARYEAELAAALRANPRCHAVFLSEEPFWDIIWGADPFSRQQFMEIDGDRFPLTVLNHATSDIFAFEHIPYFLLTDLGFATRYALRFRRNARKSPEDWADHFSNCSYQAAFIAEKRLNPKFAVSFPQEDTFGLCRFRSLVTQDYKTGQVLRAGAGWRKAPRRQALGNWHLDKLMQLDQRCRFVSALENTHQRQYVTEKFFDAFAVGAVPLYFASQGHRVHDIAPANVWVNLFNSDIETAAAHACQSIDAFAFDAPFFQSYCAIQARLADTFANPAVLLAEQDRLSAALIGELQTLATGV